MKETPHNRKRTQAFLRGEMSSSEYNKTKNSPSVAKKYRPPVTPQIAKTTDHKLPEDHITKQQFLLEFFGSFNRDFGNPQRFFVDNPSEITSFVEICALNKQPAFISVQPMKAKAKPLGFEKVFFDFDYCKNSERLSESEMKQRTADLADEVRFFLGHLSEVHINPLVVKTRRGYHVHVFFDSVYQINDQTKFWKEVYRSLQLQLLSECTCQYLDGAVIGDINRMCRIPLSIHEKSGQECNIVDSQLREDKMRGIEYYKLYGLKQKDVLGAMDRVLKQEKLAKEKSMAYVERNLLVGSESGIRPCFVKALDSGEMCHQQRLALLQEAYSLGFHSPESIIRTFQVP